MSHEITQRADKSYEFAYAGKPGWHGLGQKKEFGASLESWKIDAGMDFEVFESVISYQSMGGTHQFPDRKALFRSDTKDALSIVGADYHVVQPGQILDFFEDVTKLNGFQMSAAGTLFGGKRFWATAEVGKNFKAVDGDEINGYLLLVTSVDGTLSTQARFVAERVVCNNTLTIALGEKSKRAVSQKHSSEWNPEAFKIDLGILDAGWGKFNADIKKLTERKVSDAFARNYFSQKFFDKEKLAADQGIGAIKKVNTLMELYKGGAGAEFSYGTAYGMLNATTELFTHGTSKKRDAATQFVDSSMGDADNMKSKIFGELVGMCA